MTYDGEKTKRRNSDAIFESLRWAPHVQPHQIGPTATTSIFWMILESDFVLLILFFVLHTLRRNADCKGLAVQPSCNYSLASPGGRSVRRRMTVSLFRSNHLNLWCESPSRSHTCPASRCHSSVCESTGLPAHWSPSACTRRNGFCRPSALGVKLQYHRIAYESISLSIFCKQ